jgi:zf-MYND-like zinc finger, mRNA-binding
MKLWSSFHTERSTMTTTTATTTAAMSATDPTALASCASAGCTNPVMTKLACPKCVQFGVPAYFCSQSCFKENYDTHKQIHAALKKNAR